MFKKLEPKREWIVQDTNPIMYREIVELTFPLTQDDILAISKMISYIDASYLKQASKFKIQPGIGIAANQIGYLKQVTYIRFDEDGIEHCYLLANPKIIKRSANKLVLKAGEGCLSVKKKHNGLSIRSAIVEVEAIDIYTQKPIKIRGTKLLSACLQHEIDHLNNEFFYHRIDPIKPFDIDKEWVVI